MHVFSFHHKLSFQNNFCFQSILDCQTSFLVSKIENCFCKQKIKEKNSYQTYPQCLIRSTWTLVRIPPNIKLRQRVRPRPSLGPRNLLVSVSSEADYTILRMAKVVSRFSTLLFRILLQNPTKKSVFFSLFASSSSFFFF